MPTRERNRTAAVIELIRMRCRRCHAPWCRTPAASRECPFCGHTETAGALEVLPALAAVRERVPRAPALLEVLDLRPARPGS